MSDASVQVSMQIRRPPGEVFSAFANPQTIRKFWLTDTTGPLAPGARVQWQFMVPGATAKVVVTRFEAPRLLSFDWPEDGLHVDMTFEPFGEDGTRAAVAISGFDGAEILSEVVNTVEGFTLVLADLKTLLETGESAGLVRDKAALIVASQAARGGG
jgi:uncharacterized protein YndB with AHSA1/START domain